jgi:fructokinase
MSIRLTRLGAELSIVPYGLVIGEAFVDLIAQQRDEGLVYVPKFGGSALNVAIGTRRLGTPVRLAATLATGAFSAALQDFCVSEDIDITSLSTRVDDAFLAVATPRDGHVTYEYFGDISSLTQIQRIDDRQVAQAAVVHATSTAFLADPARDTVRRAYSAATGVRTMDPNPRPSLISDRDAYLTALQDMIDGIDVLKASEEDLAYLFPERTAQDAARRLNQRHGITVVVTRADRPTLLAHDNAVAAIPTPRIDVVDATGAGDSFMASLLADTTQHGRPDSIEGWADYVRRANHMASLTCQHPGGAEAMPTGRPSQPRVPPHGSQPEADR